MVKQRFFLIFIILIIILNVSAYMSYAKTGLGLEVGSVNLIATSIRTWFTPHFGLQALINNVAPSLRFLIGNWEIAYLEKNFDLPVRISFSVGRVFGGGTIFSDRNYITGEFELGKSFSVYQQYIYFFDPRIEDGKPVQESTGSSIGIHYYF